MIAKHMAMQSVAKSDFAELVKYLTNDQGKNERVGHISVTNCQSDKHQIGITEVLNTQIQNSRSKSDKTYHLFVSFREGEQVDSETLKIIEERICEGLGFGEHQRISVVHHDTDNLHIHVAINKIHPTRYSIHEPYRDYKTLAQLCEKLEREFGLEVDNHYPQKTRSENKADDMERHSGIQSLLGWIKRECSDQIKGAQSWTELHAVMQSNGLKIHESGNGLIITDQSGLSVKASSVAREFSKAKLEQRYGVFEPMATQKAAQSQARRSQAPPIAKIGRKPPPRSQNRLQSLSQLESMQIDNGKRYAAQPMLLRTDTSSLYPRYQQEQMTLNSARSAEWKRAMDKKYRLVEAIKRNGRLKRGVVKLTKGSGIAKKIIYAAISKEIKDEIQRINKQYLKERQEIYDKYQKRTWADWMRAKAVDGDLEALNALRSREASRGLTGNILTIKDRKKPTQQYPKQDSITKKGTIIYSDGATSVRDDGDNLKVSRNSNQDGLLSALRLAIERYGERIAVNGTVAFKEQIVLVAARAKLPITFDDTALQNRYQELVQTNLTKEKSYEYDRTRTNRERVDRGGTGRTGFATGHGGGEGKTAPERSDGTSKPNISRIGRNPPPQSQNRLRGLSELGLVQLASGSEVLLPRDVSGHMEQQGTQPDNGMRRDISGTRGVLAALTTADNAINKYIAERETKRQTIIDIPEHIRYVKDNDGEAVFAGIRQIDGETLALLKSGEKIMVLAVDEATARRLKRVAIGGTIAVTNGSIKTKGRSR